MSSKLKFNFTCMLDAMDDVGHDHDEDSEVFDGKPQLFEKVVLGVPAEGVTNSEFDREAKNRFDNGITAIVTNEGLKSRDEMLNALGKYLRDATRGRSHLVSEMREEFVRCVADRVVMLEHRYPKILSGDDFASRREFAHEAVGVAFDMLARGNSGRSSEVDEVIQDSRRWVGEGRRRETRG